MNKASAEQLQAEINAGNSPRMKPRWSWGTRERKHKKMHEDHEASQSKQQVGNEEDTDTSGGEESGIEVDEGDGQQSDAGEEVETKEDEDIDHDQAKEKPEKEGNSE